MAKEPKKAAKAEAGMDVQSGMDPGGLTPKEQRAEINKQFEAADDKGKAAIIEATQVGLQVRGY
jgi:hypothetical protein